MGMPKGIQGFAMNLILNRLPPERRNSPQAQAMIEAIKNGDEEKGKQIAENLCKTYGVTKEEAVSQATEFFGL